MTIPIIKNVGNVPINWSKAYPPPANSAVKITVYPVACRNIASLLLWKSSMFANLFLLLSEMMQLLKYIL